MSIASGFVRVGDVISLEGGNPDERHVVTDTQDASATMIVMVDGYEGLGIPGNLAEGFKGITVHEHWPLERTLAAFNRIMPGIESSSDFVELLRQRYAQPPCKIG